MMNKKLKFNHDNTIVNFSNSILKHFGCKTHHNTIKEVDEALKGHRKVVVLLFDGLGRHIIRKYLKDNAFMRKHYIHTMEATFPPTTVASTNGLLSGLYPRENGWMSWTSYVGEYDCNIQPFTNKNHNTDEYVLPRQYSIFKKICRYESVFEQIKRQNPKVDVYDYKNDSIEVGGHKSLRHGVKLINEALKSSDDVFLYFYHVSPDHELHRYGVNSLIAKKKIHDINRFMKKITKNNPDTIFFTIADHGLVDVTYLDMNEHPDLVECLYRPLSFEVRVTSYFVKNDKKETFEKLFKKYYGEDFVLLSKEDVEKVKLFGEGNKHERYDEFVGDYISISTSKYALYNSKEYTHEIKPLKGHHAGYTKEEMEIDISVYNR